jgi:hypothetical protein
MSSPALPSSLAVDFCGLRLASPIVLLSGCVGFEAALPTAAASARIFFMRASGAKGWPCLIPMAAIEPINSMSSESGGSCWTTSLSRSKKLTSVGGTVFMTLPLPLWNTVGAGALSAPKRALPARNSASVVP